MKDASDQLGISYNILYGKYREVYGPLCKSTSKQQKILVKDYHQKKSSHFTSHDLDSLNIIEYNEYSGTRQEFWEEHYVNVLLRVSTHMKN